MGNAVVPAEPVFVEKVPGISHAQRGAREQRHKHPPAANTLIGRAAIESAQLQPGDFQSRRVASVDQEEILIRRPQNAAQNCPCASGVWIINIETGRTAAFLRLSDFIDEIFAVNVLFGKSNPHIIANDGIALECSWALPQAAMKEVDLATPTRLTAPK